LLEEIVVMNIMNIVHWYFSTNKNNKCL